MSVQLSISIVAYHNYDDIKKAVSTLEEYTPTTLTKKIYIVDNGAQTGSNTEFVSFLSKYEDVQYIDAKKNLGFGKGHNFVLPLIDSEYHCIMNPDIVFTEDAFTPILEYMDNRPSVGMVIPNIVDSNGKRQNVYRKELTIFDMFIRMFCKGLFPKRMADHTLQYEDYTKPFHVPFGQGSFLVIRSSLFKKIKGFDENFFMYVEDADLCKRVNQVSTLMYFPNATVVHKWEKGSHKNKTLFKYHIQSAKYYFHKWGYKWI
ncbi:glycosyltransferase family 2 protein [Lactobacillus delbrueckii]|uniref:glycosyltransferase family 2 protein n=1 Tax=Lactobacillus delbrueckii TaxID=1584 RepID=UPI0004A5CB3D|nr:glycosyltransferase family 2 protein [Lactobacillus delbrueckii]MCD5465835.1 glycosyltransferase family 2 protein [Lactobacillus delbrueckii subsp. bulgaricus]MCT3468016.1 glycosyltransferase family 2 protein [Lactobacillus delbrueckii subsp. bulgaricus]CDR75841.1 Putative glycosyltransferase WelF [Lactobacillus delbrueckii subsp. bulgaricus]